MFRGVGAKLSAFRAGRRGVVLYLVALLMVPFVALLGVAVDVGQALLVKNQLASAIDAAALDIAATPGLTQDQANAQAQAFVNANFATQYPSATVSPLNVTLPQAQGSGSCPANTVCITASASVSTAFVRILGSQYNTLSAGVSTQVAMPQQSYCILTLDPAGWSQYGGATAGLELVGGPTLTMTGCGIAVNATGSQALMVDSGASLTSPSASIAGQIDCPWAQGNCPNNISPSGSGTVTIASLKQNQSPVADPYQNVQFPDPGTVSPNSCSANSYTSKTTLSDGSGGNCDCKNFRTNTTQTPSIPITLNPARYCQGLTIANGFKVILNPGIYYIESGTLNLAGGVDVSGSGVTFVLTTGDGGATYATLSITNGSSTTLTVSAPTTGWSAGILFFGDRNAPSSNINYFSGFTNVSLTGAFYFPTQMLYYASSGTLSGCQQVIAWDIKDALTNLAFDGTCTGTGMILNGGKPHLVE